MLVSPNRQAKVMKSLEALVASLTPEMFAFSVTVRGITYDVYRAPHPVRKTKVSIALRIRREDGQVELSAVAGGALSAESMAEKIAEMQRAESN